MNEVKRFSSITSELHKYYKTEYMKQMKTELGALGLKVVWNDSPDKRERTKLDALIDMRDYEMHIIYRGYSFIGKPSISGETIRLYYKKTKIGDYQVAAWIFNNIQKFISKQLTPA